MVPFLKSVADYLYKAHGDTLNEVCLIFPNRRAGVFFNRYLAANFDKPTWAPTVRTIAELMRELSGLQMADPLTLNYQLYQVYKKYRKSDETFDAFFYWGEMLVNDFDDIDKYRVEARQLFQNLADLKEIEAQFELPEEQMKVIREFWEHVRVHKPGSLEEDFISVWECLLDIYNDYKAELETANMAYEGMMYRKVVDALSDETPDALPYRHFAIIGFNALNNCEKTFFTWLKKNNRADFFWDYDTYYMDNHWHEAGLFVRENRMRFPAPLDFVFESDLMGKKNIDVISVSSDIGQAKAVPEILKQWDRGGDHTRWAVVLADEALLTPVLSSIPDEFSQVNVTLGYPFKYTPVYSFFELLTRLQRNIRKSGEQRRFYYRDVKAMLQHSYLQMVCANEADALATYMVKNNRVFITTDEVQPYGFLAEVFEAVTEASQFIPYLVSVGSKTARLLASTQDDGSAAFHQEYWFTFIRELVRLGDLLLTKNIQLEIPTLVKIIRKIAASLSIPFKGEPLAGLQVMGVLETRNLDFEYLVVLSANEGVLPKSDAALSFIPYNLRRGFDLPTIEHQDSVYAYYFYRLLQRAKHVALVYNSQAGNRMAEMSRFLYQMKYEPGFLLTQKAATFQVSLSDEKEIVIPKTSEVMASLMRFTCGHAEERTLTPTAINAWLECPLRFYFRYVAGIREKEEVLEDIEGSMFGKLLHFAMETLYNPYEGRPLDAASFKQLINDDAYIEECILKAFASEFYRKENERPELHGKSLVVKEILKKYILRILEVDAMHGPLVPMDFEKTVRTGIAVSSAGSDFQVWVGGTIDRIDRTNNTFRVIDYKTGKANRKFEDVEALFEPEGNKRNKEALQALLYALVLKTDAQYNRLPIVPGLYPMREIFGKQFDFRFETNKQPVENINQLEILFSEGLGKTLRQIFDPEIPFRKTPVKKSCEYCDYREICHR